MAARSGHGDASAEAPDRVDGDVQEAVTLQRQHQVRLQIGARGARAHEIAETLLAHGEGDRQPVCSSLARQLLDDLDGAHDRGGVVADAGAAQAVAVDARLVRDLPREHRVDVREQQHARAALAEAPDQVAGAVGGQPSRRIAEPLLQPLDALALVERRRRHPREREQVVEGIVHGAHAARTLSGCEAGQAAMAPGPRCALRARNAAAASIAASTLNPRSRAWAISITCSTASAL